jgi:hypothetical protein
MDTFSRKHLFFNSKAWCKSVYKLQYRNVIPVIIFWFSQVQMIHFCSLIASVSLNPIYFSNLICKFLFSLIVVTIVSLSVLSTLQKKYLNLPSIFRWCQLSDFTFPKNLHLFVETAVTHQCNISMTYSCLKVDRSVCTKDARVPTFILSISSNTRIISSIKIVFILKSLNVQRFWIYSVSRNMLQF